MSAKRVIRYEVPYLQQRNRYRNQNDFRDFFFCGSNSTCFLKMIVFFTEYHSSSWLYCKWCYSPYCLCLKFP